MNQLKDRKPGHALRIGIPVEYNTEDLDAVVRETWLNILIRLQEHGHVIHSVSLPSTQSALPAYYVLAPAEASSNLSKYDGVRFGNKYSGREANDVLYAATRGNGLGEEVKRRILLGSYSLSAAAMDNYFIKAQKVRRLVQRDFDRVFAQPHPLRETETETRRGKGVDVIISPTAQSLPPKLGSVTGSSLVNTYSDDILTVPASLAGLPAINVPVSISSDETDDPSRPRTVGLQIIGQYGDDDLVLDTGQLLEEIQR